MNWEIGLFEIGDLKKCCYSYCCLSCAMATSRHQLDESSWLYVSILSIYILIELNQVDIYR